MRKIFSCVAVALVYLMTAAVADAAQLTNGAGFTGPPFGGYSCADVAGGVPPTSAKSTPVIIFDCHGWFNQQWTLQKQTIFGLGSTGPTQTCLDVRFAGTTPGTLVDLAVCNGTVAQRWFFSNGQLINPNSHLCLDAGNRANGTQLIINTCNGSDSQQWQIK